MGLLVGFVVLRFRILKRRRHRLVSLSQQATAHGRAHASWAAAPALVAPSYRETAVRCFPCLFRFDLEHVHFVPASCRHVACFREELVLGYAKDSC